MTTATTATIPSPDQIQGEAGWGVKRCTTEVSSRNNPQMQATPQASRARCSAVAASMTGRGGCIGSEGVGGEPSGMAER